MDPSWRFVVITKTLFSHMNDKFLARTSNKNAFMLKENQNYYVRSLRWGMQLSLLKYFVYLFIYVFLTANDNLNTQKKHQY